MVPESRAGDGGSRARSGPDVSQGRGDSGVLLDDDLAIACGEGAIRLQRLQRAGRQPMPASEFLRGTRIAPGTRFL
jgi:methionyl-tRNA formyltransferase